MMCTNIPQHKAGEYLSMALCLSPFFLLLSLMGAPCFDEVTNIVTTKSIIH